ncbi:helix-turn-helix domain-containing protein [Roseateles chitosanitabidus]|jgi:excisionase family DNA binding protein|uniref:helix-turn-helix domain-containing protein n=1 Tax=Roseateles chitosanitabidus TaxID=65048 RepID=UPI0008308A4B|nr:helix-turn-helix domain-containing protein [Roseateles chitosanitabidus]MBO9687695.1 excisionase family DNA-binding protein [Roseateles chitosanitabidus]
MTAIARTPDDMQEDFSTREVAQRLGMAVRSVQLMVDRGELQAWRTPGGHRRILRSSLDAWLTGRGLAPTKPADLAPLEGAPRRLKALLIEDSVHYQNLVSLLAQQEYPDLDLHTANDGIGGLVMYGQLQPEILLVDILLPGIDGAALVTSLRSQPQFASSELIFVTALDEQQRAPYAFALAGLPLVHKPRLVTDLPPLLGAAIQRIRARQPQTAA